MKKSIIYSTVFLMIFTFNNNMMGKDLTEHKWKNRIVLVIANDSSLNQFNLQMEELRKDLPGIIDRKIVIYKILPNKYQIETTEENEWTISSDLFKDYKQTDSPFEVLLIGLDGGIKLSKDEVLTKEELFSLIDSMPMRARELENRKK
jgi:septum formation topological specificity factor MinE